MSWCGAPVFEFSYDQGVTWQQESHAQIGPGFRARVVVDGKIIWQGTAKPQVGPCLCCDGKGTQTRYFYKRDEGDTTDGTT